MDPDEVCDRKTDEPIYPFSEMSQGYPIGRNRLKLERFLFRPVLCIMVSQPFLNRCNFLSHCM